MQQNFPSGSPFLGEKFIYICTAILFLQFMQACMGKGAKVLFMLIHCSYKNILNIECIYLRDIFKEGRMLVAI